MSKSEPVLAKDRNQSQQQRKKSKWSQYPRDLPPQNGFRGGNEVE